tara:strand:+ start:204 stop:443 length:240 start_codon:yes stop_codon:yes gene_type:complete
MTITKKHLIPLAHMVALCGVLTELKDVTKTTSLEIVRNKIREFTIEHSDDFDGDKWVHGVNREKESIESKLLQELKILK